MLTFSYAASLRPYTTHMTENLSKLAVYAFTILLLNQTANAENLSGLESSQVCLSVSVLIDNEVNKELELIATESILNRNSSYGSLIPFKPDDCRSVLRFTLGGNTKIFPGRVVYLYQMDLKLIGVETESILDLSGASYNRNLKLENVYIWRTQGIAADSNYASLKEWTGKLAGNYLEQFIQDWKKQH